MSEPVLETTKFAQTLISTCNICKSYTEIIVSVNGDFGVNNKEIKNSGVGYKSYTHNDNWI